MMKNIVTFEPNDFLLNKLRGFDPKYSGESFKTGLKSVRCVFKEFNEFFDYFHRVYFRNNDEEVGSRMKRCVMYNIDQVRLVGGSHNFSIQLSNQGWHSINSKVMSIR